MRICIDVQSAITQRAGVGRYTMQLVQNLAPLATEDELALFYFDFKRKGRPLDVPGCEHRAVRWCPGRLVQWSWKVLHWPPAGIFTGKADLYHFPNFIIPPMGHGAKVVTVHDMSFLRYPHFAEDKNQRYLSAKIRDTVGRADAIITDSRFSSDEIRDFFAVDNDRLFPVHLGVDAMFASGMDEAVKEDAMRTLGLERPYILTVGTIEPRKNIPFLVDVFERLESFDGDLVVAGMPGWKYETIMERFQASPKRDRIRYLDYVDDTMLPALYSGASLFAFTSHYEGFGFPPLEAMACGVPVVSATGGSLAEVLDGGAMLVEGYDLDDWVDRVSTMLTDTGMRASFTAKGRKLVAGYSWSETARQTWNVYEAVCK
ncbi:MAG: glycosyltransferase family 1 protein [Kiritimatiellia bacterium]|jgi:glycosyltransferase involved in cell wall biosynthesis|nr:glycosyltransferase family 1 protein [Kiritimatiellia bacterium]MDP6847752.1 glycosyltransferase family 1 protein [Kiritimatiellia bacterium]